MNKPTDIISRMEAMQQRFGEMPPDERARRNKFASEIAIALHTETKKPCRSGEYFDREMANRSDNGTLDYLSYEQEAE